MQEDMGGAIDIILVRLDSRYLVIRLLQIDQRREDRKKGIV